MFTQKESQYTAQLAVARLVPVGLARRAPDGQQRSAHLRDAGDRSDQPERASADLPVERHPRPVAGGGARGGRQGRHHLQLDLHELLARRDGVERLVAQPDRSAHRGRERAHRARRSSSARVRVRHERVRRRTTGRGGRRASARFDEPPLPPPTDIDAAHRISAALDGRPLDAPRHRRLRADRDDGAARDGGRSARNDPAADLRGQPPDDRGRHGRGSRRRSSCRSTRSTTRARRRISSTGSCVAASKSIAPNAAFEADGKTYAAGTFVIPMTQVFARYAKDLLEKQTYPEVRRSAERTRRTALRRHRVVARHAVRRRRRRSSRTPLPASLKMTRVDEPAGDAWPARAAAVRDSRFDYKAPTRRSRSTVC